MGTTGTLSTFEQNGPTLDEDEQMRLDNIKIGHSANFKAVTRSKLDRIQGTRPAYEKIFMNAVGQYRVNYDQMDRKITGKVVFDSPEVKARAPHPDKLCRRGLTRLAEMALDVKRSPNKHISVGMLHDSSKPSLTKHQKRLNQSQIAISRMDSSSQIHGRDRGNSFDLEPFNDEEICIDLKD